LKVLYSGKSGREMFVDGLGVGRTSDYLASSGLVVWMGNEDIRLVKGPAGGRRHYLDFLGSQVFKDYLGTLRQYEKAVRSRNLLLRNHRIDWRGVDAYSAVLVRSGTILVQRRGELLDLLTQAAADVHGRVGGGGEELSLTYCPDVAEDFSDTLEVFRDKDARRGLTLRGPHRDDVGILVNGHAAAKFASEGQQRTVALSLKLAQAEVLQSRLSQVPLLLIDDIFGELDPGRRNALLASLPEGGQRIVTTTRLDWATDALQPEAVIHVADGELRDSSP